jgi:glycosyltransferase involved in cell wall biosynthesis
MLTVLLATRNRAWILQVVLQAFCRLEQPAGGWKLVVVDNGSTDQTGDVLGSFANRLPLHGAFEPAAGKNLALNTGLALLEGDLTVLTDDDVFPDANWLVELRRAADAQPTYSMFGGAIVPRWEVPPPHWMQWTETAPVYTLTDPSWKAGPFASSLVFGPNMALRTSIFRSGTRFDPSIGPRDTSYPMGSETELLQRLERQGHTAWHVPSAIVEHFIRAEQLTKEWVLQRAIRYGRGKYRLSSRTEVSGAGRSVPTRLLLNRRLLKEGLIIAAASILFRQETLFRGLWRFNYWRGQAAEARILSRNRSSSPPATEAQEPGLLQAQRREAGGSAGTAQSSNLKTKSG